MARNNSTNICMLDEALKLLNVQPVGGDKIVAKAAGRQLKEVSNTVAHPLHQLRLTTALKGVAAVNCDFHGVADRGHNWSVDLRAAVLDHGQWDGKIGPCLVDAELVKDSKELTGLGIVQALQKRNQQTPGWNIDSLTL